MTELSDKEPFWAVVLMRTSAAMFISSVAIGVTALWNMWFSDTNLWIVSLTVFVIGAALFLISGRPLFEKET